MRLMLQLVVKREDVERARNLLLEFGQEYEMLYGKNHMTMNFHLLIHHVHQNCLKFGPLCGYWCFSFEKMLGYIKRFVHGTKKPESSFIFGSKIVNMCPMLENREFSRLFADITPQKYA